MLAKLKPGMLKAKASSSLHPTLLTPEGLKERVEAGWHLPNYTKAAHGVKPDALVGCSSGI